MMMGLRPCLPPRPQPFARPFGRHNCDSFRGYTALKHLESAPVVVGAAYLYRLTRTIV